MFSVKVPTKDVSFVKTGGSSEGSNGSNDNLPNQILTAMQKNKLVSPMLDQFIKKSGIDTNDILSSLSVGDITIKEESK